MSEICFLDLETCSLLDLRKTGASRYSRDPSTQVTVIAWAFGNNPVKSITLPGRALPHEIAEHVASGGVISGWNSGGFEFVFLQNYFGVAIGAEQVLDTMQAALHAGLPGALGDCGPALRLPIVKDVSAHRLMLQMARPRLVKDGVIRWWHDEDPAKLQALRTYCETDVAAERAIAKNIPPLPAREKQISVLDRRANTRGVMLDRGLIHRMIAVADDATRDLNAECTQLTNGEVTSPGTQGAKLLAWLGDFAPASGSLAKDDVKEALKREDLPDHVRRVLELRQLAAKSSVKKLKAMLSCVDDADDRVRGVLAYYGASRTGRAAGRLIQPQNFPRPSIKDPNCAIQFMLRGGDSAGVGMLFGSPLNVLASCLRGAIVPGPGRKFVVFDLSQIEARVLAWVAGQNDILEVFKRGEDVYTYAQQKIGLNSRQEGKVAVLGLGYGMGPNKFIDTALTYGLVFTPARADEIVKGWREANEKIVRLWWDTDKKIKELIRGAQIADNGRAQVEINSWVSAEITPARNGTPLMTILLPSGRRLFYREIALVKDEAGRDAITYMGVDQKTRKWDRIRSFGAKLVENIVQAVARDVIFDMALEIDTLGVSDLVLSVHDELIEEVDAETAEIAYEQIKRVMNKAPAWAPGLPVGADGHIMARYGK